MECGSPRRMLRLHQIRGLSCDLQFLSSLFTAAASLLVFSRRMKYCNCEIETVWAALL